MRRAVTAAAALVLIGCVGGAAAPGTEAGGALRIAAEPVEIAPAELHGLALRGAAVLTAPHPEFGGFSGLLVRDGRMTAVTDRAWLLEAAIDGDAAADATGAATGGAGALAPEALRFAPLEGEGGEALGKSGGDAEALAESGDRLAVSFERDHRIAFTEGTRLRDTIRARAFEALSGNSGLEALASLPGGRLLAIAEQAGEDGFPVFVVGRDGRIVTEGRLPQGGRHAVTGADVGPDGRLYLLRRDFAMLLGVSARVERYHLGEDGLPRPETREVLARFESASGIDNMEGIALWQDAGGRTRLALISDDNFSLVQRTLLMDFEVLR